MHKMHFVNLPSDLFYPCRFPAAELHHDAMQRRPLAHQLHLGATSITAYLSHGIFPLYFTPELVIFGGEILQLYNVAVLHFGIALKVGHQEKIAEAVVQFHLGSGEVIGVDAEIGLEEALDIALALYQAADGGVVLVVMSYLF